VFGIERCRTLDEHAAGLVVVPLAEVAAAAFPVRKLDAVAARIVAHGGWIPTQDPAPEGPVAAFDPDGRFIALLGNSRGRSWPTTVFVGPGEID
jgi:tRNA pseudouridine55 synthase